MELRVLGLAALCSCLLSTSFHFADAAARQKRHANNGHRNIAVIGEGVVGLSTATAVMHMLQQHPELGTATITVYSDQSFEDTLSRGIAGLFRIDDGTPINRIYGNDTFNWHAHLFREFGGLSGVQLVSGHIVSANRTALELQEKYYGDIVYNFRFLEDREIRQLLKLEDYAVSAIHYSAYTSEGLHYCPFLKQQLKDYGVIFKYRHITSVDELGDEFDLVFNCAGIRGGEVANDGDAANVYPIRGIILKMDAPWQKHFLYRDFGTISIPVIDGVYIGTVKQEHRNKSAVTEEEIEEIRQRYGRLQPAMLRAQVLSKFMGVRPGRHSVRVEAVDKVSVSGRSFKVVHNYGHSGNGFTLGYGTGVHAAMLGLEMDISRYSNALNKDNGHFDCKH